MDNGYSMTNYNKRNIEAVAYGYSKTNYNKRHIEVVANGYSKTNYNKCHIEAVAYGYSLRLIIISAIFRWLHMDIL